MKKSIELKETRSGYVETLEAIKNTAEGEERNLNEAEATEVDTILAKIDSVDTEIKRAERVEAELRTAAAVSGTKVTPINTAKELGAFTFQGAVRAAYTGNVEGIYKEMDEEARNEARYTGQSFKGVGIPASILTRANTTASDVNNEVVQSFTDQLESNLVMASAGANFYGGVNNLKFPVFSGIDSTWVSEDGSSGTVSTNGTTSSVTLSPKKLISIVNMSQESMVQSAGLESALQRNMAANIAATLETALLDTADVTNAPASIFADAATGPTTILIADWVEMETDVLAAGVATEGARLAYVGDVDAYKAWKTLAQIASVSPAYDNADKRLNGIYAFASANVAASGSASKAHCLYGDYSKVHIAQFGGLDILFDPYTNAATGLPRMIVTSLADGNAVQNATAFVQLTEA